MTGWRGSHPAHDKRPQGNGGWAACKKDVVVSCVLLIVLPMCNNRAYTMEVPR
jgi:hypothetical protein